MAMIQGIRDRAQGWLAWVIVGLISIPFALWGIQQYLGPDPTVPVAEVNSTELTLQQFQQSYERQRVRLRNMLGPDADMSLIDDQELRQHTIDSMINDELLVQTGANAGLRISDEQMARAIQVQDSFQRDGRFAADLYDQWLSQQGYTPGMFEFEFRRSLLTEQVFTGVARSEVVTGHEVDNVMRLVRQERDMSQVLIDAAKLQEETIDEEAVSAYYEANKGRFMSEEQVNVQYVLLARDDVAREIQVDDSELEQAYEARKASFGVPEERKVRHILVQVAQGAGEAEEQAARERIDDLAKQIADGGDFSEIARKNSEDPGSAPQGGDLGFFSAGAMDPAFEEASFALAVGEVSEPVRSSFGFHLIVVDEIRESTVRPFAEVRDALLREMQGERAESGYFERAEQLANLSFEQPDNLDTVSETLGLSLRETGFFGRGGLPGDAVADDRRVIESAFSAEVLKDGNNSQVLELPGDRVVVLRVKEHKRSEQRSLEDTSEEIAGMIRAEQGRKRAMEIGKELLAAVRAGASGEDVLERHGLSWSERTTVRRSDTNADPQVMRAVFRMPHPAEGETAYDGAVTTGGDFAVLALHEVRDPAPPEGEQAASGREATRNALIRDMGNGAYSAYMADLRRSAKVILHPENL